MDGNEIAVEAQGEIGVGPAAVEAFVHAKSKPRVYARKMKVLHGLL